MAIGLSQKYHFKSSYDKIDILRLLQPLTAKFSYVHSYLNYLLANEINFPHVLSDPGPITVYACE